MALKRNERYPGRFDNPTENHPQGGFKNRTAPDANDGSYLERDWANDWDGFFSSILTNAGVEANGSVDNAQSSQYFDALSSLLLLKSNNGSDIASKPNFRTNLGLGSTATRNVGLGINDVPDMTNFARLLGTSGYQKLPGGVTIQWGRGLYGDGQIVNFPVPFTTAVCSVTISSNPSDDTGRTEVSQAYPISNSQFRTGCSIYNNGFVSANLNCTWIAIGY